MHISNFEDTIRVGSHWPNVVDVKPLPDQHESNAIIAKCHTYRDNDSGYVQVRKSVQCNEIALVTCRYTTNNKLPKEWEDSIVLWDSRDEDKNDQLLKEIEEKTILWLKEQNL